MYGCLFVCILVMMVENGYIHNISSKLSMCFTAIFESQSISFECLFALESIHTNIHTHSSQYQIYTFLAIVAEDLESSAKIYFLLCINCQYGYDDTLIKKLPSILRNLFPITRNMRKHCCKRKHISDLLSDLELKGKYARRKIRGNIGAL